MNLETLSPAAWLLIRKLDSYTEALDASPPDPVLVAEARRNLNVAEDGLRRALQS